MTHMPQIQTQAAQNDLSTPIESFPEVIANEMPAEDICKAFFKHDCLLIRGLLAPEKLAWFRALCEEQFERDDRRFTAQENLTEEFTREYKNGWIWEQRLREMTNGAFGYDDIMLNRKSAKIVAGIMGKDWYTTSACQLRRMAARREQAWGSWTTYHLDAQWGIDHRYMLNFWTPFTPCGANSGAPGLEVVLASASAMRAYGKYDPTISYKEKGKHGISKRVDEEQFVPEVIQKNIHPSRFWNPHYEPGDVMIFSNWTAHRTYATAEMTDVRISLEWRVGIQDFDTRLRPGGATPLPANIVIDQ